MRLHLLLQKWTPRLSLYHRSVRILIAPASALPHGKSYLAILFVLEKIQQDGTFWVRRLSQHQSYEELGSNYVDERDRHNTEKRLVRRLEKLGYHVELHPVAPAA